MLPEHDVVVVDEAHELVDRVTGVATAELSATALGVAARDAAARLVEPERRRPARGRRGRRSPRRIDDAEPGRMDDARRRAGHRT